MNEPNRPSTRLVPARPDMGDAKRSGFLPRIPWNYVGLSLGLLVAIAVAYTWRQDQRAAELRAELRRVHNTELKDVSAQYQGTLRRLAALSHAAAAAPTTTYIDPDLRLAALHDARGLYLRIPLSSADNAAKTASAARAMKPDWIPGCLGLNPTSARELYDIGAFLLPSFVNTLDEENLMRLRVRMETLHQRMEHDLPNLRAAMQAPWFMLVLQEGDSRSEQPVRVFLWDMPHDKLLLRARVRARGILLTSHILSQGVDTHRAPKLGPNGATAANDCSIASALKRLVSSQHAAP